MPVGYITPEHFKDAFLSAIKARESELTSFWAKDYYSQPKVGSYTAYFLNVILRDVAEKLRLAVWPRDYYTLDAVLYQEADTVNFPYETYAKSISVAIEHEHYAKDAHREINKLQLFNAPLKVLFVYSSIQSERQELLRKWANMIQEADVFEEFSNTKKQLVIFGTSVAPIEWFFYCYIDGTFKGI